MINRFRLLLGTIVALALATPMLTFAVTTGKASEPAFPIRAAFFYPWFPEAWTQHGIYPYTQYHPSLGFYDSSSSSVIAGQIAAMQYGNIEVGIASWWGQGTPTDKRIPLLLGGAAKTSFRWTLYYEKEGYSDPTVAQIQSDLAYVNVNYAVDPAYLRIQGKPVIFVYADPNDACAMATRWAQANATGSFYVVLKVFSGYAGCADQPDNWHQYGPVSTEDSQTGHSFTISPGFWKVSETTPRLARNLSTWTRNIADMVASNAPFQLISTFNEWGEGTSVESASEWATSSGFGAYLDALHANPGTSGSPAPTPSPTQPARVPPTSYLTPLPAWRASASVRLAWGAIPGDAAVTSYDVRYRRAAWNGGFGSSYFLRSETAVTGATFVASTGSTYCFSVRARDALGSLSAWTGETCTAIPLDDRSLSRSGSWVAGTGSAYYRSTYLRSSAYGAKLVRTGVVARRIAIVATTCPTCGSVQVYWGSTLLRTISLNSATTVNHKLISVTTFSSTRRGTVTVTVSSSGRKVLIDGLAIRRN